MNRRLWIPATIAALGLMILPADGADHPLAGKWTSDAAVALKRWREVRDKVTPADFGGFHVDQGLRGNDGGVLSGGGRFGGGDVGQRGLGGGREFVAAGQFAPGRGVNPGGGGGPFGGRDGPYEVWPNDRNTPPWELRNGPAVSAEFKVDKKNRLTGTLILLSIDKDADEKYKIEDGKVDGNRFEFFTRRKVKNVQTSTGWKGEMTTDNTIRATRLTPAGAGAPADEEPLTLRRQK